jgi:conjugal transfer pilus assembly protein TraV
MGDAINPYDENFNCKATESKGKCIDTPTAYEDARYPSAAENDALNINQLEAQENRYKVLTALLQQERQPMLLPPKIMRVLMLPYEGQDQELFMTRYVYIKIEDSNWILTDIDEE